MQDFPSICVFIETYYPQVGGTTTHARLLARDLTQRGLKHFVITRRLSSDIPKQELVDDLQVIRVGPVGDGALKKWGMLIFALPALFKHRHDFDTIYVPGFRVIGMLAIGFSWVFRKKCVLRGVSCGEMSGAFFDDSANKLPFGLRHLFRGFIVLRNKVLRRADAIVAISEDLADELKQGGVEDSRVVRIPNAVDMDIYHPVNDARDVREKLGLPLEGIVVIYTGRLVSYKGLLPLLNAWIKVKSAEIKQPVHLVLVGAGSNDIHNCEDELHNFVEKNGLSESVTFTGDVYDVAPYLQSADIFAFPTENEAFGISLIEAMACGLPSVSTDVGGVKDIVRHESNALVFPVGDVEAMTDALLRLIEDDKLRRELGSGALETVRSKFSTEKISGQYFDLFERVNRR